MKIVIIIPDELYPELVNKSFSKNCFFNPVKDYYNNWVISIEELLHIENKEFNWIWNLPQSIYNPPFLDNDQLF